MILIVRPRKGSDVVLGLGSTFGEHAFTCPQIQPRRLLPRRCRARPRRSAVSARALPTLPQALFASARHGNALPSFLLLSRTSDDPDHHQLDWSSAKPNVIPESYEEIVAFLVEVSKEDLDPDMPGSDEPRSSIAVTVLSAAQGTRVTRHIEHLPYRY